MVSAEKLVGELTKKGFELFTGVPCSYLKPLINYVIDSKDLRYVGAANEGDAVGIAAGAHLGGKRAVVIFQNSGFGNTVNPLTSMNAIFRIPVLIISTLRGEPGGPADEPQHELMGQITPQLFDLMRIPWEYLPQQEADIVLAIERASRYMETEHKPYAFIMKKDSVAPYKLKTKAAQKPLPSGPAELPALPAPGSARPTRRQVLKYFQDHCGEKDVLLATTGYTGRVLYALDDRPNQLYMVGAMGCVSSLGLGLAMCRPDRRIIVFDGDGAALMRLGAFATIGYERPPNLVHVLLDNEVHDSTGGQSTVTHSVDLAHVARACGYGNVLRPDSLDALAGSFESLGNGLSFIHVKIAPGESDDLPRPTVTPAEVAIRLKEWLGRA